MRDAGHSPTQMEPVFAGHIPFGDGDETGEPRFGAEHIVITGVEFALRHPVSNRENMAFHVIEKPKIHVIE